MTEQQYLQSLEDELTGKPTREELDEYKRILNSLFTFEG